MIDRSSLPVVSPAGMLRLGPPGSEILKDFRVIAKLGEGPLGVAYRAYQVSLAREIVLKILAPRAAAEARVVERFVHEGRLAITLDHPNMMRGLAMGEEQGLHYLTMESVDGESLDHYLARLGQLSVGDTLRIARDVAQALHYAHSRNIRHRDVRTASIMITRDGEVKLTDVGFAKVMTERIEVTTRDDVNALGATMYQLLTGKRPFADDNVYEALTAPAPAAYEPVYRVNPKIPNAIDQLVARAMSRDPTRRFQDAHELVAAIESTGLVNETLELTALDANRTAEWAATQVLPHRPTPPAPAKPRAARAARPLPWIAGAVVAAVVLMAVAVWQFYPGVSPTTLPVERATPVGGAAQGEGEPVDTILARAVTEATSGKGEQARTTLAQGLQAHPGNAQLQRPLAELTQGVLIVFQYRTPEETSPRVPLWAATDVSLTPRDGYRFAIIPGRACYVYAFQRDARAGVSRMFPNERYAPVTNPVVPNTLYWLPSLADASIPTWLRVEAVNGEESAYFVAVTKALRDPQALGQRLLESPERASTELMRDLDAHLVSGGAPGTSCFASGSAVQSFSFTHK